MPSVLLTSQIIVIWLLLGSLLALELWALISALRAPRSAFTAAGKLSKTAWVSLLTLAALVGFACLPPAFGRISMAFFLASVAGSVALVYLWMVRPYAKRHRPPGNPPPKASGW